MNKKERFNFIADKTIKGCLCAIVFAAPFSKSISEVSITLSIILWLCKKIVNKDFRLKKTDLNIPLAIFVLTVIPSLFISAYPSLSIRAFFTKLLKYIGLYFVMVESIDTKSKLKDLLIMAFLSIIIITADGIVQHYYSRVDLLHLPGYPSFKWRNPAQTNGFFRGFPTACFPFPNDFAAWILLVLFPIACATIFDLRKNKIRYLMGLTSLILFHLFLLTKARGAWIGLTASTVFIALSKSKMWLILLLLIAITVPFVLKMEMAGYIFDFGSIGDRFGMWGTSFEIFKKHPIVGNGLNTFFENFRICRNDRWKGQKGSYAHNCYLQMAADTGLIGLAGFLWLIFSYFQSVIKNLAKIKDKFYNSIVWGMSIGIFAFLVHSFFDTNLYSLNLVTLFWAAIGVSQTIINVSRSKEDE